MSVDKSADKNLSTAKSSTQKTPQSALAPAFAELAEFAAKPTPQVYSGLVSFWGVAGCNVIVFMTSVCIMVIELVGSRLINKSVGNSLYTWTSVIGVVLAGISVGNFLGGWLADRFSHQKLLGYLFGISSLLCLAIYPFHEFVGSYDRPSWASWQTWVVIVVTANFFLPALALGTISPVVASMALAQTRKTGSTLGNVYAWGALGSIVGTFLTGFYLINTFGTQNIIWMTAAVLAIMGALVAARERVFRAAMLFGWLQFVCWVGLFAAARSPDRNAIDWKSQLLGAFHKVGLQLKLRGDTADDYRAESNYYAISVGDRREKGDNIKALYLDHLTHSYYNPAEPTKLYYDYELVYAAVTERAARRWNRLTSVPLAKFPGEIPNRLPEAVEFDPSQKVLKVQGALGDGQRDQLLQLSSGWAYWKAVAELLQNSNQGQLAGLTAVELDELPEGVEFPRDLQDKVRFDSSLGQLICYGVLKPEDIRRLQRLGPDQAYREAVETLFKDSRAVSTFFIGGGGFIFPRWIEAKFPHRPRIDVAEIDPAVKLAVQLEMGLPADDETQVHTIIGDARNVVDDRVRANAALLARGESPILYDFAYGDAFNDFSVPWHLTTLEFTRKVKQMLNPEGVYLVNIIDVYPRAEYPDSTPGKKPKKGRKPDKDQAEIPDKHVQKLPPVLQPAHETTKEWVASRAPFQQLETYQERAQGEYVLGYRGRMSSEARAQLVALAAADLDADPEYPTAIKSLFEQSRAQQAGRFLGSYLKTVCEVYPYVYVFSSYVDQPTSSRDTFVVACSNRKLDLERLEETSEHWSGGPFATMETDSDGGRNFQGQMSVLLELSQGMTLTDDYAPVDNLLIPVFSDQ